MIGYMRVNMVLGRDICGSQVNSVCQDTADSVDNRARLGTIIIELAKASDLVPHDWLL
jgi:hypothetical protein